MIVEAVKPTTSTNPFPGLRPFTEKEEYLFFGRERQINAMVDRLADTHFLAVMGSSGCGKSSLVNCGLQPALHRGLMVQAGSSWRIAKFRPGNNPIKAMAESLAEDGLLFHDDASTEVPLAEVIEATLRMSKLGLIDIYKQAGLNADSNLLIIVDQFEELFRYRQLLHSEQTNPTHLHEEAWAFLNLLLEFAEQTSYPFYVVVTMRSDFIGDCAQFPGLPEAINAGQYLVPRMTREERRLAISGPVGVGGANMAPVLLTRLVNDVGDNPDQLSILQHALNRTWARWEEDGRPDLPIELRHYEAIGTMGHALDLHAESAYEELKGERQQQICEKIFKALTDTATDPRGVRRPTTLGMLCALAEATELEVTAVIDVFRDPTRSFLMPPAGEALSSEKVVDISHESLMRVWTRLKKWADEEAASALRYRRLSEAAALHADGKASLWRNPELQLGNEWRKKEQPTEAWATRYGGELEQALTFLDRSARAQLMRMGGLVALGLLVVALLGWWGINQKLIAEEKAKLAKNKQTLLENSIAFAEEQETFAQEQQKIAQKLQTELDTFLERNPLLKKDVSELRLSNRELTLRVLEIEYENRGLTWQQDELKRIQKILERRRQTLQTQIQNVEKRIPKLEEEIQKLTEEKNKAREVENQVDKERTTIKTELNQVWQKNNDLRKQAYTRGILIPHIEDLPEGLSREGLSDQLAHMVPQNDELAMLEPQIVPGERQEFPGYDELAHLREENRRLQLTADELRKSNEVLQARVQQLERKRDELLEVVNSLKQENADKEKQNDQLQEQRIELAEKERKARKARSIARYQVEKIERRIDAKKYQISLIQGLIKQTRSENEYLTFLINTPPQELKEQMLRHWQSK